MAYCSKHDCYFGIGHDLGVDIKREAILEKCPECAEEDRDRRENLDMHGNVIMQRDDD